MALNTSFFPRISNAPGVRYAAALVATAVALLLRLALNPILGDYAPYIVLFPAVAFCAWFCGVGPSIFSVVLALVGTKYWFIPPVHSLRIDSTPQWVGALAFLLGSSALVAMGETRRRHEKVLTEAQGE